MRADPGHRACAVWGFGLRVSCASSVGGAYTCVRRSGWKWVEDPREEKWVQVGGRPA
jgi:hypothetical protein